MVLNPHHILLNKGHKTNVGGVVGFHWKKILLIHHMPLPPTLILTQCQNVAFMTTKLQSYMSFMTGYDYMTL